MIIAIQEMNQAPKQISDLKSEIPNRLNHFLGDVHVILGSIGKLGVPRGKL